MGHCLEKKGQPLFPGAEKMMKIGFLSVILAELSFEEIVEFAAANGLSYVEVPCWPVGKATRKYAGVTHIDVNKLTDGKVRSINSLLRQKNVAISGLGFYPNPLDPDRKAAKAAVAHLKKVIAAAAKLGIPVVNTFIGRDPAKNLEENFKQFKATWPSIIKHAERLKVKVAIENCPMYFTNDEWPSGKNLGHSPAIWRRMFREIPSRNFGLNFDPSHFVWQMMDPVPAIHEFKNKIFHVHCKDVKMHWDRLDDVGILATPLSFHTPKIPGLGDVDWGAFFSALTDIGYKGPAVIEVEDGAFEGSLNSRKASVTQSVNFLRQFFPA
jgi:sugar phosphate isomerase/epimerase